MYMLFLHYHVSNVMCQTTQVCENWKKKAQATPSPSLEADLLRVKACVEIALRCVKPDRKERPFIKDIVRDLEELEAEIKRMEQASNQSKDIIGQVRSI